MKKKASDQVVDYIQGRILAGEWVTGMKISTETKLQEETGFGKATVREAVEKLVAMGILHKRQGDGTYVTDFSAGSMLQELSPELLLNQHDALSILEFREIVEPEGLRLFIGRYDENVYQDLKMNLEKMKQHQNDTDSKVFYEADRDFHLALAKGSGNTILMRVMEILNQDLTRYHYTANRTIGSRSGVQEHEAVLNAIEKRDAELGSLLLKRHIQRSRHDMQKYMEKTK